MSISVVQKLHHLLGFTAPQASCSITLLVIVFGGVVAWHSGTLVSRDHWQ
jgi:hypothetical protein